MAGWPTGTGRVIHPVLDGTNAEALRQAAAGARGPVWILAEAQSQGRGRRGRGWKMLPGNFAATLLMAPPGGLRHAALRSFVAALALQDALVALTGRPEVFELKWPNDVLLSGGKLAGILLETCGGGAALAVGIGVNLAAAPDADAVEAGALAPVSLAGALGLTVTAEDLLDGLAPAFAHWEARLVREGFAPLREAWLARAGGIGSEVVARLPNAEHRGRFETINADGAMVLATASGRLVLPAAELHFAGPAFAGEGIVHAAGH